MRTLNLNKVDAAAEKYFAKIKEENLLDEHDMIILTDDYQFRLANKEMVKLSEEPKYILRAYRIDSLGNLWVA
jgi:hypothetical protein